MIKISSVDILYICSLILQIGATYYFVKCAKFLGMRKINPFTLAFGLIVVRRLIVQFLITLIPSQFYYSIMYANTFIVPVIFSLLLFIGIVQLYSNLIKFKNINK